jgi:hypothetical protein
MKNYIFESKYLTFVDFLLSEAIRPQGTKYGTDLINGQWKELNKHFNVTFFESNDNIFAVVFKEGHVGFYTNYTDKKINFKLINTYSELTTKFHFNRKPIPNVISVFNYVFFVIIQAIKKFNPEHIYFNGSDPGLDAFYSKLVSNKIFLEEIEKLNYEYIGKAVPPGSSLEVFTFNKIN